MSELRPLTLDNKKPAVYNSTNRDEIEYDDKTLSIGEMVRLTICMAGLQFTWTVELSYGSPYLKSLGLTPELIALVWLAGPLSGLLIQPLVGAISDRSTSKFGRRRPYIIIGGFLVCLSMAGIAYSKEWAKVYLGMNNSKNDDDDEEINKFAVYIAVFAFYCLDFSLNAVQASCRALILDIPPFYQQETGNAWAGRMMHIGNVIGYFTGFLNLTAVFPMLGNTQLKVLCIIACIIFILSLLITCLSVKEKVYEAVEDDDKPWWHTFVYIYKAFRYLPVPIQRICNVQFFAWMGWFPFLFFSTTWVAEIYAFAHPSEDPNGEDFIYKATRVGSFALLIFSFVSVAAGTILPHLTPSSYLSQNPFTIYNIYTVSHIIFFIIMMTTFFVRTEYHAIAVIASIGIPWAVAMWVPFALVGEFVQKEDVEAIVENTHVRPIENHDIEHESSLAPASSSSSPLAPDEQNEEEVVVEEEEFDAGMILGVHNMYIVFPQFVISLISAGIFKLVNRISANGGGVEIGRDDAVGWVLRFGGVMALVAAVLSCYLIDLRVYRQA
ncbi:sugar transporter [Glomus cerebriforme]|uniref:Sugar transporter n=1 Tax=Glomus cerebriforme TaxID=658196 RepID=A0A397SSN6_9GLOM|nr:sugar transporter [Glomus cerebriforme]